MRHLFFSLGLASVLATSIYAEDQQGSSKYGLYCTDAQVDKILPKKFNVPADGSVSTMIYSPADVKNNKKTKSAEVWVISFMKPEGNRGAQQGGLGDVGYQRMLHQYNYANNKEKRLRAAFYTCEGELLITLPEKDWEYTIPGSMNAGVIEDIKAKKIVK